MAQYRQIHLKIWSSPDFQALSSEGKFVFIYLFSNSHRNEAALYRITPKTISNETDLSIEVVMVALTELSTNELIKWDQTNNIIWVVNAIKYQKLSPNEVTGIKKNLASFEHEYVYELLDYYEELFSNYEVPSQELNSKSKQPSGKGKGKGKGKDKGKDKGKGKYAIDSVEVALSQYLYQKILTNDPGHKPPNIQLWAEHMEYILRVDKRPPEEIRAVIDFAQSDTFWIPNILSTKKLREKYAQLNLKRLNPGNGRGSPVSKEVLEKRSAQGKRQNETYETFIPPG